MNIGIVGTGAIGGFLLRQLCLDPDFAVVAVSELDREKALDLLKEVGLPESLLMPFEQYPAETDVFIEAASASVAKTVAEFALSRGKIAIVASIAGLGDLEQLRALGERTGGRLILPSGAIAGLDALKAIPADSINEVLLTTSKPAATLANEPYLVERGVSTMAFIEPTRVFEGTAREAAAAFPRSANVAAALAHASLGLDDVRVEIWVDPQGDRNRHSIRVESGHGTVVTEAANVPFEVNPRTSRLAAYSILATVRSLAKPIVVGT